MSVRINRRNDQENGHSGKQEGTGFEIAVLIPKKAIQHRRRNIGKPQKIRNDKYLTEWYIIINCHVDYMKPVCDILFQMCKPAQIEDGIQDEWNSMAVFQKYLSDGFHNTFLGHENDSLQ